MPRNGTGTYSLPNPAFTPGSTISSSAVNGDLSDIASALTGSVSSDGQTTLTGALKFPNGTVSAPSISFASETVSGWYFNTTNDLRLAINGVDALQATASTVNILGAHVLQSNGTPIVPINWIAAGGSADAITATYSPVLTVLTDGLLCFFRATASNATTTPTFSPNGLTAHTITKKGGVALIAGDIPGNLAEIILRYNLANTRWEILNPTNPATTPKAPTFQNLTSGSGATYTTPTGPVPLYLRVKMCGGGGGGTNNGGTAGGIGGTTTFNSITAIGGSPGSGQVAGLGGTGGTGSVTLRLRGGPGGSGSAGSASGGSFTGNGGATPFFGGAGLSTASTGGAGAANTGGGGASGAAALSAAPNGSAGSGEYVEFFIANPTTTYTYTIGAGGLAGTGGGNAGGAGGTGTVLVEEYYQ